MSKHHFIPAHERAGLSRLEAELIGKHDATIKAAIDIEQLPKGTAILIPPSHRYLDDDHAGAGSAGMGGQHARCVRCDIRLLLWVGGRRVGAEQCAGCCDVVGAVGVGEEPVVADAVEAPGQHVQEKAPDELVRVKPHRLPAARTVDAIVFPAERDAGVVGCNEAVRDGDPVGVTRKIAQHMLRSGERGLAIDDHLMRRSGAMKRLKVVLSASPACALKNFNWPASRDGSRPTHRPP